MILAGDWVTDGGISCRSSSYRGVYENSSFCSCALQCGLFSTYPVLDGARHYHDLRLHLCPLHGDPSWMMSYSHLRVKEGTAPFCDGDRIWNTLLFGNIQVLVRQLQMRIFDCTLGFPGEGPKWAMISANVDSFITNVNCLHWEADAFMLQEARIAHSNMLDAQRKAALCNFQVFCSQPLQKTKVSSGGYRIPSGGTATCANKELAKLFDAQDDVSGTWPLVCSTARVTATWHQVSSSVKMLAFNFYAIANAASERQKFERNNELLHQIFMVAAQYADIPIVLAGDFQMEPGMYPAVQLALDHWGWADPLLHTDETGMVTRPATFFQRNAPTDVDGQSSIDGILVNRTALTALLGVEVLPHQDRQHRPVRATFVWDRIHMKGTMLQRLAKMNLEHVHTADPANPHCPVQASAEQLWLQYTNEFDDATSSDAKWEVYNRYAVQLLIQNGASWEKGPRVRGALPKFQTVQRCSLQDENGSCASPHLLLLRAILRSLRELEFRFHRTESGMGDTRTFRNTQQKLLRRLKVAKLVPFTLRQIFAQDLPHLIEITLKALDHELRCLKFAAINRWRESMKDATKSMTIGKIVYQFLKRKGRVVPPNLVEDDLGNIIYDPQQAMDAIATKWDTVFAVNATHEQEMQVLKQVWPYIHDKGKNITLPPIDEYQLWKQAAHRRPDAAAGLDGWMTREVQSLPPSAFKPVAWIFNQIEAGNIDFPTILTQVRMVIHNKDGSDAPLSKRLISLQSVFTLLYTGLRFMQLQSWQQEVIPWQLKGGIKGRQMAEVHLTIQQEIDAAHCLHGSFSGLKLDKSKCFDRLVPKLCAALMLALGLPRGLVCGFLALYTRMTRYLSFKQWTRSQPISTANGVVQGCSLSLLCINLHIAVWAWLMRHIDGMDFRAFIDDTYLWTRLPSIDKLVAAVRATELWDSLCGQFLNASKCEIFASSSGLRQQLRLAFPTMKVVEVVNILGAHVQTTKKNVGNFPTAKIQAALRDCESIRSLPCDSYKRAQILATKVLPQVAFAPQLNFIPKRLLAKLQCAIADALWQNRPMWRSKHLLLCVIHKAHKLDPFLFRAVTTITESVRFLQSSEHARMYWKRLYQQDQLTPQAWMTHFGQACCILDLDWCSPFGFAMLDAPEVNFLDFSVQDLKCLLKNIAANKCYTTACLMPRKDIQKATGFLDLPMTLSAKKKLAAILNPGFSFLFFWESALTGCTLTADRLAASGIVESADCRFCGNGKESMQHLAYECLGLPPDLQQPASTFYFGPNFSLLGVAESPMDVIRAKLQVSNTAELQVQEWERPTDVYRHVWTDGSVQLASYPWLTMASYAVVADDGRLLDSGRVWHWRLSSYSAELWAILAAFSAATEPVVVHSDSLTIVNQFGDLLRHDKIQMEWTHAQWWGFLLTLIHRRRQYIAQPLKLVWCPAHLLEEFAIDQITEQQARDAGSTLQDIRLNRTADEFAKHHIHGAAAKLKAELQTKENDVFARHLWLAKINRACKKPDNVPAAPPVVTTAPTERLTSRQLCPRWAWDSKPSDYTWTACIDSSLHGPGKLPLSASNFSVFLQFMNSLHWRLGEGYACSVFELSAAAFLSGFRFELPEGTICTLQAYAAVIRAAISFCKAKNYVVAPLLLDKGNKCNGKTFPKGAFFGAEVFLENKTLELLSRAFERGAKATPHSWALPFDSLL